MEAPLAGSLKFQAHVIVCASAIVVLLVNDTRPVVGKQVGLVNVKLALGFALTSIVLVTESLHPPAVVNTYLMVCVPIPASDGVKFPAASVPGPEYTPVPVTPLVTLAVAMETGVVSFWQRAASTGYVKAGFTLNVAVMVVSPTHPLLVVAVNNILNVPSRKLWVGFCAVDVFGLPPVAFGSLKFHAHVIVCASAMVLLLVNDTSPVVGKQVGLVNVKLALGLALTRMVCVIESLQPPAVVNTYLIVCVPIPASDGVKLPDASVPGPEYTPVPVTPLVTLADATETGVVSFWQRAASTG